MKSDYVFGKFNICYCVRGYFWKGFSLGSLNFYFPVVKWTMVRSMLILECIIYFLNQGFIDFANEFSQEVFHEGGKYSMNLPGVSIVMGVNMILFSIEEKPIRSC